MVSFDEQSFSIFMWPYSLNSSLVLSLACLRNPPLPECLSWELRGTASEKEMCMQTAYCRVLSGTRPVREWESECVQWGDLNCDATARQSHRALWNGKDATELCWVEVRRSGFYTLCHPQREPDVDNQQPTLPAAEDTGYTLICLTVYPWCQADLLVLYAKFTPGTSSSRILFGLSPIKNLKVVG